MKIARFVPFPCRLTPSDEQLLAGAKRFYESMRSRRTVRDFSGRPVPRQVIEDCIRAAGTAPNGANLQPWHFVAISDPKLKTEIRAAAEKEEKEFYEHRAPKEWLEALAPILTVFDKPLPLTAAWIIAGFVQSLLGFPGLTPPTHSYA